MVFFLKTGTTFTFVKNKIKILINQKGYQLGNIIQQNSMELHPQISVQFFLRRVQEFHTLLGLFPWNSTYEILMEYNKKKK